MSSVEETIHGYGVRVPCAPIEELEFPAVPLADDYVELDVLMCGVCHSDLHRLHDSWSRLGIKTIFPLSCGHEVVGRISKVGAAVTGFALGDRVGCGPLRSGNCHYQRRAELCENCLAGEENLCLNGAIPLYSGNTGGFCSRLRIQSHYAFHIPENLPSHYAAPLLCAGITTFSPLKQANIGPGSKVAILGIGGLGSVAVQIATAMGADVYAISTSPDKIALVQKYGGKGLVLLNDEQAIVEKKFFFDYILNTVSGSIAFEPLLSMLKPKGELCCVGLGDEKIQINPFAFVSTNKKITGSYIGGTKEMKDMLQFCADHKIYPEIEVVDVPFHADNSGKVDEAVQRVRENKVRYRMVLDYKKE